MLLFWGLVVGFIVWLVGLCAAPRRTDNSLEVLRRRFAAGEISLEDFDKMRKALGA